jgi:hypothetical protein
MLHEVQIVPCNWGHFGRDYRGGFNPIRLLCIFLEQSLCQVSNGAVLHTPQMPATHPQLVGQTVGMRALYIALKQHLIHLPARRIWRFLRIGSHTLNRRNQIAPQGSRSGRLTG